MLKRDLTREMDIFIESILDESFIKLKVLSSSDFQQSAAIFLHRNRLLQKNNNSAVNMGAGIY